MLEAESGAYWEQVPRTSQRRLEVVTLSLRKRCPAPGQREPGCSARSSHGADTWVGEDRVLPARPQPLCRCSAPRGRSLHGEAREVGGPTAAFPTPGWDRPRRGGGPGSPAPLPQAGSCPHSSARLPAPRCSRLSPTWPAGSQAKASFWLQLRATCCQAAPRSPLRPRQPLLCPVSPSH